MNRRNFLGLISLFGCSEDMLLAQHGLLGDFSKYSGHDFFLVMGDSNARGSAGDGIAPTPAVANTVFGVQYSDLSIHEITNVDFNPYFVTPNAPNDIGTPWPYFGDEYYAKTSRKAVIFNCGVPATTYYGVTPSTCWDPATSTLYADVVAKAQTLLANVGKNSFKAIFVILGVNDGVSASSTTNIGDAMDRFFDDLVLEFPNTPIVVSQPGRHGSTIRSIKMTFVRGSHKIAWSVNNDVYPGPAILNYTNNSLLMADNIHPNNSGNSFFGKNWARWVWNHGLGYSKLANAMICNLFDDPTTTRKNLFETFVASIDPTDLDCLYIFKTSDSKNWTMDFSLSVIPSNVGAVFTANDSLALNGSAQYLQTGVEGDVTTINALAADAFLMGKVKVNNTAAGTAGYLMGRYNSGATRNADVFQSSGSLIAGRINIGSVTGSYVTDTKFQNDSAYGVYVNGTAQQLTKNGSDVGTPGSGTNSGFFSGLLYLGGVNNNGTFQSKLDCTVEWFAYGRFSITSQSTLYTALEALIDGW